MVWGTPPQNKNTIQEVIIKSFHIVFTEERQLNLKALKVFLATNPAALIEPLISIINDKPEGINYNTICFNAALIFYQFLEVSPNSEFKELIFNKLVEFLKFPSMSVRLISGFILKLLNKENLLEGNLSEKEIKALQWFKDPLFLDEVFKKILNPVE